MNLYEITREALELASLLETEELTPELEAALVINQEQLQAKAGNYAKVIANIQSDADAIDTEIKRLKAMKESKERAIDRLKDAVKNAMLVSNIDKIESPLFKLALRRSESVEVDLVEALPSDFRNIKNVVTADKVAIKEAIKRGENVIGARLIENFNLQIKWVQILRCAWGQIVPTKKLVTDTRPSRATTKVTLWSRQLRTANVKCTGAQTLNQFIIN